MAAKRVDDGLSGVFGDRSGFGDVGDSASCYDRVVRGTKRLKEIEEVYEHRGKG